MVLLEPGVGAGKRCKTYQMPETQKATSVQKGYASGGVQACNGRGRSNETLRLMYRG